MRRGKGDHNTDEVGVSKQTLREVCYHSPLSAAFSIQPTHPSMLPWCKTCSIAAEDGVCPSADAPGTPALVSLTPPLPPLAFSAGRYVPRCGAGLASTVLGEGRTVTLQPRTQAHWVAAVRAHQWRCAVQLRLCRFPFPRTKSRLLSTSGFKKPFFVTPHVHAHVVAAPRLTPVSAVTALSVPCRLWSSREAGRTHNEKKHGGSCTTHLSQPLSPPSLHSAVVGVVECSAGAAAPRPPPPRRRWLWPPPSAPAHARSLHADSSTRSTRLRRTAPRPQCGRQRRESSRR